MNKIPSGRFSKINPIKALYRTNFTKAGFNPVEVQECVRLPHLDIDNLENMTIFSHLSRMRPSLEKFAREKGVTINIVSPSSQPPARNALQKLLKKDKSHFNTHDLLFEITDSKTGKTATVGFTDLFPAKTDKKTGQMQFIKSMHLNLQNNQFAKFNESLNETLNNGINNLTGSSKFSSLFDVSM